ncbi:MAG: helix-turn-helix domain-containing protein [Planctomycetota bacterium]
MDRGQPVERKRGLIPIGAAAKSAGVTRQSLQYYLMVGLLEPADVTKTGRRLFDQKSIERIKLVKKLNDNGYPLRAIREIFLEGRTDLKGSRR